ncbi:MAG: InlB B-repeat-containing protein [Lachnospiraceae bacterium]|nr:InlB B-repeat-containing protein [Lachnospiraceae bacterium]
MEKRKNRKRTWLLTVAVFLLVLFPGISSHAEGSMFDSPYVVPYSHAQADGTVERYFTISQPAPVDKNRGESAYVWHSYEEYLKSGACPSYWYSAGTTITTGIASSLRALNAGEHYYDIHRTGEIPVGKWVVSWERGRCIHGANQKHEWKGLAVGDDICMGTYYSGWLSYCADCGQPLLNAYVYAPKDRVETIRYINTNYGYYYICQNPACNHLENEGYAQAHVCKQVSANRYVVKYDGNGAVPLPSGDYADVSGRMLNSLHMYDNATEFEGMKVNPVTRLTKCSYTRKSYDFIGWNTEPDGSGTAFSDGQEIYNLTEYNYLNDEREPDPRGYVILYAQWVETASALRIDPAEGTYDGREGVTEICQGYGSSYFVDSEKVNAKSLHQVSFEVNGGTNLKPLKVPRKFMGWKQETPFLGKMRGDTYYFTARNGNVDLLRATYENAEIILPTPTKKGFLFGGWFEDAECERKPVGFGGDPYLTKESVTLYANWSDLTLWSKENYEANDQKGAVDLSWEQTDAVPKAYKLYQSADGVAYTQLNDIEGEGLDAVVKEFAYTGSIKKYTIPSSGFYELEAYGAQGGDDAALGKKGGCGGKVTARFYLKKGDELTVQVGGTGGFGGGGSADAYGRGGGATTFWSASEGLLLLAGGGGGATEFANGGAGGSELGLREDGVSEGQGGNAGGGSGYVGGKAGVVERHYHSDACQLDHVHGPECYEETKEERVCRILRSGVHGVGWTYAGTAASEYCPICKKVTGKVVFHYHVLHDSCGAADWGGECTKSDYGEYFTQSTRHVCAECGYLFVQFPGYDENDSYLSHAYHVKVLHLICPIDLLHGCKYGYEEGQVLHTAASFGGSSYISEAAIAGEQTAGAREGNGMAVIRSVSIGMSDGQKKDGVAAPDLAAPDAIDEETVWLDVITEELLDIHWEKPKDHGTPYWFRCESFHAGTGERLCVSNVTKNMLVTGIAGYYYVIDQNSELTVTASNAENAGTPHKEQRLRYRLVGEKEYLHLAPVDGAGNMGPTINIKLFGTEQTALSWPVVTRSITAEAFDEKQENVYLSPKGVTYVRADGITPFKLSFEAFLLGTASDQYQITEERFCLSYDEAGEAYCFRTYLPKSRALEGMTEAEALPVAQFVRQGAGEEVILTDAGLTGAYRGMNGTWNMFWQGFFAPAWTSGRKIVVMPGAAAGEENEYRSSAWEDDVLHSICLTADGIAPVITVNQELSADGVINAKDFTDKKLVFHAEDDLSGLKSFVLRVCNQDNGDKRTFYGDALGNIVMEMDPTTHLFDGDVTIELTAFDNVANVTELSFGKTEFELEAAVIRLLPPHNPLFKRGESGMLRIRTRGYVDRIQVEFPKELMEENEEWNRIFSYEMPAYEAKEELIFMIPLDLTEDGTYEITVRAYKGQGMLEEKPRLCTISILGSVLDELRTRLR